jgi:DNA-binding GntR family transcriptional regulator
MSPESPRPKVHEVLLGMMRDGTLPPGTRLAERDLAERLGVSRTPVREALALLAERGFVERVPGGAWFVRALDLARIAELSDVRAVLEGHAARLFVRAATDADMAMLAGLAEGVERAVRGGDIGRVSQADVAFHTFLVERCGNRELAGILSTSRLLTASGLALLPLDEQAAIPQVAGRHRRLVEVLRRRDPDEAEKAVRAHMVHRALERRDAG